MLRGARRAGRVGRATCQRANSPARLLRRSPAATRVGRLPRRRVFRNSCFTRASTFGVAVFQNLFWPLPPAPRARCSGGGRAGPTGRAEGQRANAPPCRLAHPSADQLQGCTLPSVRNRCFARARTLDVAASQNLTTLLQGRASARLVVTSRAPSRFCPLSPSQATLGGFRASYPK